MMIMENFIKYFKAIQGDVHIVAKKSGWWDYDNKKLDGVKIALMHSELSEALEALRNGNPVSDKIPGFGNLTEELADTIIRIMDYAQARNLALGEAIISKHLYNKDRPYKHGGKEF